MERSDEVNRFIEAWGSMGLLWGINRSMARIHALLLVSEERIDSEEISNALSISRGNVSMCLKELRNWGVIQRVHVSGDRCDYYVAEPDSWKMLYRIAVGRKAREFDPAVNALRHLLAEVDTGSSANVHDRLTQLESLFSTFDNIITGFLASEQKSKTILEFLRTVTPK